MTEDQCDYAARQRGCGVAARGARAAAANARSASRLDIPRRFGRPSHGIGGGLRELGYVEGRNIIVEYRFGESSVELLSAFATELARINVSVIVANGTSAVRAARRAAPEIPIVFLSADPKARDQGGNKQDTTELRVHLHNPQRSGC